MGKKLKKGKGRLDKYYYLAKEQGFRSRAAFKLVQLNRKYNFLSSASGVLDLCAAPGGWLQVAAKYAPVTTKIVGVDLDSIRPIRNVTSFQCDITTAKCRSELKRIFQNRKIEVVLHDGAPNVGQAWTQDAFTQSQLVLAALKLATEFLKPGGTFVTKVFRSSDYNSLLWVFHQLFHKVEATKPQASRNTSAEIFVVCQGFKDQKIDPKLLDPKYAFKEVEDDASLRVINIFAKKQPKRKPRIGYEDGNILNFKQASVHDFVHTDNPIKLLGTFNALSFEDEQSQAYKKHRKTDAEVITLCEDLRVLNKQDFKKLLKWRTALLADEVKEEEKEEEAPPAELTAEQEEELLEKELSDRISSLTQKEKRVKRKLTKKKQKLAEKLKLKMVLPNDQLDVPEEDALFKLNSIDSGKQLMEVVNDNVTVPETELVDEEDEEQFVEEEDEESDEDSYMNKVEENLNFMYEKYLQRKNKSKPTADLNPESLSDDEDGESNNKRKADVLYKPKISGNVDSDEEVDPDDLEDVDSESEEENDSESDGEYSKVFSKSAKKPKFKENDNPLLVDPAKPSIAKKTAMWFSQPLFQGINLESDDEEAEEQTKQSKANNVDSDSEDENVNEEPSSKKRKEPEPEEAETEIEVVPRQRFLDELDDEGKVTALALGHMMVNSKRLKQDLIDRSYNRYAFDDSQNAPAWFQEEELKYNKPQIPLTREAIQEVRKKMMALDARPIKKVAEAKARKKIRALRKLSKAKTQAEAIVDNPELNQRQKSQEIEKVFKKANKAVDKKPERVYVVAHKFQKGKVNTSAQRKKGNRVRVVDPRQKKDLKAMKAKAKVKARHAGKKKK